MAADVLGFVDSIAASPTVALNLNSQSRPGYYLRDFSAPPPRLRRAASSNLMRDGGHVSSSTYEMRTVTVTLDLWATSQDTLATLIQNLARELDKATNILRYQPDGLTKPVFFKTFRADVSGLVPFFVNAGFYQFTVEIPAEPFALGLRETVSVGTVNNDPAAGSNGCYFDVAAASCIGDVATPLVMVDTGTVSDGGFVLAARQHGTPTDLPVVIQCESMTPGTDTANPGGAANATMSGSGTTNYMETTFATDINVSARLSYTTATAETQAALTGRFRVLAVVMRDGTAGSEITLRARYGLGSSAQHSNDPVTLTTDLSGISARQVVDLGVVAWESPLPTVRPVPFLELAASGPSGGDDLWWDCVHLVPADESMMLVSDADTSDDLVVDGENLRVYAAATGTSIHTGTTMTMEDADVAGGFPRLIPNRVNRFFYMKWKAVGGAQEITKTRTGTVTLYYQPQYLHIRPSAS